MYPLRPSRKKSSIKKKKKIKNSRRKINHKLSGGKLSWRLFFLGLLHWLLVPQRRLLHGLEPQSHLFGELGSFGTRLDFFDDLGHRDLQPGYALLAQHYGPYEVVGKTDEFVLQVEVAVVPVEKLNKFNYYFMKKVYYLLLRVQIITIIFSLLVSAIIKYLLKLIKT